MNEKGVAIVSGGMDSVTLAHMLAETTRELHLVSFDYGQRHKKELVFARECASSLGARFDVIDLSGVQPLLKGSALTDPDVDVPEGHYAHESMKLTVVPNRNAIMLAIATGIAVAEKANYVATGVHAGDHFIYPDCKPEFILAMSRAMILGNEGFATDDFAIEAPFSSMGKHNIVEVGFSIKHQVDYSKTWSCYKGEEVHCGVCGTCTERREAFSLAGYPDPTIYASTEN